MTTIRFFAGAAEAAGTARLDVDVHEQTLAQLLARVSEGNDLLAKVIERSTLLADGRRVSPAEAANGVAELDVLPPFAGG